jgi:hypothetical protein
MRFHAPQDIVESANCFYDVRSFVEHDALGAFSHRSIRYFRTGRDAVLGEGLENLCCPDYRQVGNAF